MASTFVAQSAKQWWKRMSPNFKAFLTLVVLLSCFVLASKIKADSIYIGGWSTHIASPDRQYNQNHKLIAYDNDQWLFAAFRNSHDRDSFAVAKGWHKNTSQFRLSIYGGAVYGYRSCYGDEGEEGRICPLIVPSVAWTGYKIQPALFLMGEALVASVRYQF